MLMFVDERDRISIFKSTLCRGSFSHVSHELCHGLLSNLGIRTRTPSPLVLRLAMSTERVQLVLQGDATSSRSAVVISCLAVKTHLLQVGLLDHGGQKGLESDLFVDRVG